MRERVLAVLKQHGWNATSFQCLEPGFSYWFADGGWGAEEQSDGAPIGRAPDSLRRVPPDDDTACVAYVDTGRAWVAAGAPIAALERLAEVSARFAEEARRHGRRACFFAAEERLSEASAMDAVLLGEQPEWDPGAWDAVRKGSRSLREQLRRARAKGIRVRVAGAEEVTGDDSPTRRAMQGLVERWLASRAMAPLGFLVDVEPFAFAAERRYFLAEKDGALVGFLVAVPVYARQGWLLEDLLRDRTTPNGTAELLVDAAMSQLAAEGAQYVTMGLAPLAGPVHGALRAIRELTALLYDFAGVRAFKAKLKPDRWVPIYLAYPRDSSAPVALADSLAAFAGGSFTQFGLRTLLRGPSAVVATLAVLLVPWTIAIALVDPHTWFPAPWVQHAWVAFDVALAAALIALARRWRDRLGRAVAAAVTLDAAVTAWEALAFNVPRAHNAGAALVITVACIAPAVAAGVLWGAVLNRRVALHGIH